MSLTKMKERHILNELKKKIYLFYLSQKIHVTSKNIPGMKMKGWKPFSKLIEPKSRLK